MAFATMHFAVGMAAGGGLGVACSMLFRRRLRWLPAWMTLGGVWAMVPDMPRLFTEDFPNAPFAAVLGSRPLRDWLQSYGDVFVFHRMLDQQPKEFALHGMLGIVAMYNAVFLLQWLSGWRLSRGKPIKTPQRDGPTSMRFGV